MDHESKMKFPSDQQEDSAGIGDELGNELLRRYLAGEPMEMGELLQFAAWCWRIPNNADSRMMKQLLKEPPQASGIVGPRLLQVILLEVREHISEAGKWTEADVEVYNEAREKRAICICADDSSPLAGRIAAALSALLEVTDHDDVTRPTTTIWGAELARRLVVEYGRREFAKVGRQMFELVALSTNDSADALRYLRHYSELALHELMPGAVSDDAWRITRGAISSAFRAAKPMNEFGQSLHRALRVSFTGDRDFLVNLVDDVIQRACSTDVKILKYEIVSALQQLFAGILAAIKLRVAIGRPAHADGRIVLCNLARAIAKARSGSAQWGQTACVLEKESHERLSEYRNSLDEAAISQYVDALLRPDAGDRRGLAMSGGGFRAACFHLGVLARLAECDELRRIDVISCVSGGSIAGSGYAVRLKALLASKADLDITRQDYIEVIEDLIASMADLMRSNLRMRALANPIAVFKLWLMPNYTITERIAELIDDGLFAPLMAGKHPELRGLTASQLARLRSRGASMNLPGALGRATRTPVSWPLGPWDLDVPPLGEEVSFDSASEENQLRHAKVPEVVFNTTAVNTGAAYRFSGQAHGERPDPHSADISNRPRWIWLRYEDLNARLLWDTVSMTLARIVAASASVPGLLPPVLMRRAGQDALIALTDGGVFDNQGIHHLQDARCARVLLSDGAGQLRFEPHPDVSALSLMMRATDILMERVRELGYKQLIEARSEGRLESFLHLHLTKELTEEAPQAAFRLDDAVQHSMSAYRDGLPTSFGIPRATQGLLARLRTDLDCFSDIEIYSLMFDGYMQAISVEDAPPTNAAEGAPLHDWTFRAIEPEMVTPAHGRVLSVLQAGQHRFFRIPRLGWSLLVENAGGGQRFIRAFALSFLAALGLAIVWLARLAVPTATSVIGNLAVLLMGGVGAFVLIAKLLPNGEGKRWALKLISGPLLVAAMFYAWVVLALADPLYRAIGRLVQSATKTNACE